MYMFDKLINKPKRFDVFMAGCGKGSFIGPCAWLPNFPRPLYDIYALCPSRDADGAYWAGVNYEIPSSRVFWKFQELIDRAVSNQLAVLGIATPTGAHYDQLSIALKAGVKNIICDKPVVRTLYEAESLVELAKMKNARVVVSYNHRYNSPVMALRHLVKMAGPENVASIEAGFLQGWLQDDPGIRQSEWRLSDQLCGLLDIGTHAADLASFVAGSPVREISAAKLGTAGKHGRRVFDNGSWNTCFENGISGSVRFHQALPGHADDIYVVVRFRNDNAVMFRMEWHPDALFVSGHTDASLEMESVWRRELRGLSSLELDGMGKIFPDSVLAACSKNPPGHVEGWDHYWTVLFSAAAGYFYRKIGDLQEGQGPPVMSLPVPLLEDAGLETARVVEAVVSSAAHEGKSIEIAA